MHHEHAHPTVSAQPTSRRTLLKALAASSVAVGAGALLPGLAGAAHATPAGGSPANPNGKQNGNGHRLVNINRIGIQLYTVRDKVSSLGFRTVFEELGDIGYAEVEFAGYTQGANGPITPAELRALLDDNGLRATGSHVTLTPANIDAQIETALTLGTPFLGQGGQITRGTTVAEWQRTAQTWNEMGAKAKAAGLKLYIHNHAGEFAFTSDDPTRRIYDLLWDEFDPELVAFEMDVYWAHVGRHLYPGFEPIDYVTRAPNRFPLLHLKDGRINPANGNGYDIIEFGAGDIDYQRFLSQVNGGGRLHGIYEQDNAAAAAVPPNPLNSLGNADRSYDAISALRD